MSGHLRRSQPDATEMAFCCYPRCKADADPRLEGEPMCVQHATRVYLVIKEQVTKSLLATGATLPPDQQRVMDLRAAARRRVQGTGTWDKDTPGLIYYMRFGNQVKIGWTSNIKGRIAALRPDEVMATEDGTIQDEKARHMRFGDAWLEREMFRLTPELVSHIKSLREAA